MTGPESEAMYSLRDAPFAANGAVIRNHRRFIRNWLSSGENVSDAAGVLPIVPIRRLLRQKKEISLIIPYVKGNAIKVRADMLALPSVMPRP